MKIDDLREPQLDEAQRAALEYGATLDVTFDVDELLAAARRRTGLADFGADDFVTRLRAMIDAV